MAVTDQLVQSGTWVVDIHKEDGVEQMVCVNRPAISLGEGMVRIADAQFERWMHWGSVDTIHIYQQAQRTLLELVEIVSPEKLRDKAARFKTDSVDEDDFVTAQILVAAAEMYDNVNQMFVDQDEGMGGNVRE